MSDKVLVNLLNICEVALRFSPVFEDYAFCQDFTRKLFSDFLFPPKVDFSSFHYSPSYVQDTIHMLSTKSKSRDSHKAAYGLLPVLGSLHPDNFALIIELLNRFEEGIPPISSWDYSFSALPKASASGS